MTWPTGPPPMPPAGWYHDPEQAMTWRWWDGATWTDHRAPVWTPPPRDPTTFSSWFERSFDVVKVAVRRVGLIVAGVWVAWASASVALIVVVYTSGRGRELRQLIDDGSTMVGSTTVGWSDAEADRAWELFQEIFWSSLVWGILLSIALVVVSVWTYALVAQVAVAAVDDPDDNADAAAPPAERLGTIARVALRRSAAVLATSLLLGLIMSGALVVAALPVMLVLILDGSGAAIGLTVFFCVCAALVLLSWLWGRLALSTVIAAVGGHGLGLRRSWDLTNGHFWYVVGRLLVAGFVAGAASSAVNFSGNIVGMLGLVVGVIFFVLLTAVSSAITTIVSVCAQVVIVDQVARLDEPAAAT